MNAARTLLALAVLGLAQAAVADWDESMPHKMHFPQLPDPYGWDVNVTHFTLADDFRCTGSGPVNDIHFWISTRGDQEHLLNEIHGISVVIRENIPAEIGVPESFSKPGDCIRLIWRTTDENGRTLDWGYTKCCWPDPASG